MRHYYQYFCSVSRNTSMCSVCGGCLFTEFHLFLSSKSLLTVASQNQLETMHCLTTITLTIIVIHTLPSFHPLIFVSFSNFSLSSSTYVQYLPPLHLYVCSSCIFTPLFSHHAIFQSHATPNSAVPSLSFINLLLLLTIIK